MWQSDPILERSSSFIRRLSLCEVRLHHNALFPWILLIPMREGIVELFDLEPLDRHLLMEETTRAAQVMTDIFTPTKINVGALGNVVRTFHMHVVARLEDDPLWPKGIWGSDLYQDYTSTEKDIIIHRIDEAFE